MLLLDITPQTLGRLQTLAAQACCTVDELLNRWCDAHQNIAERSQTQEALRQNEQRLRSLIESQTAYIIRVDMNGNYTYVNQPFIDVYGWLCEEEMIGTTCFNSVIAEDQNKMRQAAEASIAAPGKPVQVILRKPAQDGGFMWTLWEFVAIQDSSGSVTEIQCIGFDITQQIHAEQIRLEREHFKTLLQKEREYNAYVQQTVSAIAHDVRIPLAIIGSAKEMLERYYGRLDEAARREKLDSIGKQLRYLVEMLDDMAITVKGSLTTKAFKPVPVNLVALCQLTLNEIQATTGNRHRFQFMNNTMLSLVLLDETLISRILLNLLSNAVKFSEDGSEIRLELSQANGWLVLSVSDQGMGIAPDHQARIFEPFYRTSSAQSIPGTGLGLSIVKDCVTHHQGRIHVESAVGVGTTFFVEIPLVLPS